MTVVPPSIRIAVLDDYQKVATDMADWSAVRARADIDVFHDTIAEPDALVARLSPFDVVCVMRERTPLPRVIIERLPKLKLIVSTGPRNASLAEDAAAERGIVVRHTGGSAVAPIELSWALIQAAARDIVGEANGLRAGGWQRSVGEELAGQTLGVLGLGRIGGRIARIARLFDMQVITWSPNITQQRADEAGVRLVARDALFAEADILTIHLVLADATRLLVGERELARMKPTARLVNTSRGAIVDEQALIRALRNGKLAGAALDVFDTEPLPPDHPFRSLGNVLATPHIGYVSRQQYQTFYRDTVRAIMVWLDARRPGG